MGTTDGFNMRALYTQIQLPPAPIGGGDEQLYYERLSKNENLLNQNFLTLQLQLGELSALVKSLSDWASQF